MEMTPVEYRQRATDIFKMIESGETLSAVASKWGLSLERVRQIHKKESLMQDGVIAEMKRDITELRQRIYSLSIMVNTLLQKEKANG